ncbi:hypothetical protein D9613_012967 [Agrocybe pediades]|uniref:Uncharacterized protein n=1 Tax=Agrocybe pediades TaxID=84607 RepID=A0A8H4QX92_9AGAR|nr:hypothetical protein D9613_012967 [Agrocybe pediades]
MTDSTEPDPRYCTKHTVDGRARYSCNVCGDGRLHELRKYRRHEESQSHQLNLSNFVKSTPAADSSTSTATAAITDEVVLTDALRYLADSFIRDPDELPYPIDHPSLPPNYDSRSHPRTRSPVTGIDYNLWSINEDTTAEKSYDDQMKEDLARITRDLLNVGITVAEDPNPFGVDVEDDDAGLPLPEDMDESLPRKRARGNATDPETARQWFPWPDRITCSLDILMHLPRSVFSRKQLDLFLWLLRVNKVNDVPSVKSMTTLHKTLQSVCGGVETKEYVGRLGHRYHVNNLHQILAQEMSNPKIRTSLHFYPEDAGEHLSEARHGARWLSELRPEETTPMIRVNGADYYIFEPTMLRNGSVCMPFRWFTRKDPRSGRDIFYCRAWVLESAEHGQQAGWVVCEDRIVEVCEADLLKDFPTLVRDFSRFCIPDPRSILGITSSPDARVNGGDGLKPWKHTDPGVGNRWRSLSKGHRTLAVPLWLYCDDTSGNTSKKWNEHNSFLFSLAGLPRDEAAKEYNIHFLCTSNLAPPLEMMEGVVGQIESAQQNGIWAWDCALREPVLIFPAVLALLGDNPMQSEFACHIGLTGKFFCRTCWVKGTDAQDSANAAPAAPAVQIPENREASPVASPNLRNSSPAPSIPQRNTSPAPSIASVAPSSVGDMASDSDVDSVTSATAIPNLTKASVEKGSGGRGRFKESMQAMLTRIKSFIKPARLRTRAETMNILESYLEKAKQINTKTELRNARTDSGIKDTTQEHFLERLSKSYQGISKTKDKEAALDAAVSNLPHDISSPVWRLTGLDPHQDTPVEILHVVLLGFVKYFWRDLVKNRLASDEEKALLITRLNDFDVSGLGIPKLAGQTLVQYAGSLTGRDFRVISQVAPFVIRDLVSKEIYEAWVSLSTLVPLIWQPVITNVTNYMTILRAEIHSFLLKTARWSTSWFNKAKFHIITHLPDHVYRFGPAILFATEAFESFNAVIRGKSTHSNRQAPSRDIAHAFAQGNRVRHLFSGGYFVPSLPSGGPELNNQGWRTIGSAARALIGDDRIPLSYLGLSANSRKKPGQQLFKRKVESQTD